jgi:uncharacterized protein (DUF736 family)
MTDLFDATEWRPEPVSLAIGMTARLDRTCDREQPCCENIAVIRPGKAQHAGELRCAGCDRHRGWLPQAAMNFLTAITQRFGAPAEPVVLRDSTIAIGDETMATKTYDNRNTGALFKNEDKESEKHPDYRGPLNVDGREFWISGWLKISRKGTKYMSLSIKPQDAEKSKPKASVAEDLDDAIPF